MNLVRGDSWRHQRVEFVEFFFSVKKTKSEIAAQRASHAAKDMLGKERREEQEQNVQRKKALAEKSRRMLLVQLARRQTTMTAFKGAERRG